VHRIVNACKVVVTNRGVPICRLVIDTEIFTISVGPDKIAKNRYKTEQSCHGGATYTLCYTANTVVFCILITQQMLRAVIEMRDSTTYC